MTSASYWCIEEETSKQKCVFQKDFAFIPKQRAEPNWSEKFGLKYQHLLFHTSYCKFPLCNQWCNIIPTYFQMQKIRMFTKLSWVCFLDCLLSSSSVDLLHPTFSLKTRPCTGCSLQLQDEIGLNKKNIL